MSDRNMLKDLIKSAQTGFMDNSNPTKNTELPDSPPVVKEKSSPEKANIIHDNKVERKEEITQQPEHEKKARKSKKKSDTSVGSIVEEMRAMEKSSTSDIMIHVRIKDNVHKKLLLYGQDNLKIQAIVSYAINYLLDTEEMKDLLNTIKNDME